MDQQRGRLHELVQTLDALGSAPSLVALAHALDQSKLTAADVAPFVVPNQQAYHRAQVVLREHYELLVMTWLPGQASMPHDHMGSICAMQIVQGEAAEGCYRVAPDGYVDLEYETRVRAGEVTSGQDAGVHTVRNPSQTGELLVTVHVYAPPLKDFRRFVPRPAAPADAAPPVGEERPTIVVVGGGFSGSMTAAQILDRAARSAFGVRVVLVERRGAVGEGLAYSTRESVHLLNVPAGRMSAWPERPDDFVQWASRRKGPIQPGDFLPRQWYGEYVRNSLLTSANNAAETAELSVVLDEVRRVARHPQGGWMVHVARGPSLRADAVVLAIGHRPPLDPIGKKWTGPRARLIADPWRPFAMNVVGPREEVAILGSGLTAVDAVLSLAKFPRRSPITLISRNGLMPLAHSKSPVVADDLSALVSGLLAVPGGVQAKDLFRSVRRRAHEVAESDGDWRSVVDGLRPFTAALWRAMPTDQRRRFLSRIRPFWEVHRHRMALPIAEKFRALLAKGDVRVIAGRVESAQGGENGVRLVVRARGSERALEADAAWVINCTGPMPSNSAESNPVVGSLLVNGWLLSDELSLGIETSALGHARDADGRDVADLFVVGTLRKPATWESTAVPELRVQAATVAERVLEFVSKRPAILAATQS
jgi:uncharacterized NAD(P)/FAD-binding protein YdhS